MYAITEHSHCRAVSIPPVANLNVTSQREATIARWPHSEIRPPRELAFAAGQTVFYDGDEARFFFEIVTGTLRCCRITRGGRRQIYRFAGAGEMLGLGGEHLHRYSAEAVTEVVVRRHPLLSLNAAMATDHQLRERVGPRYWRNYLRSSWRLRSVGQYIAKISGRKINEFKRLRVIELMRSDRIRHAGSSHLAKPAQAA